MSHAYILDTSQYEDRARRFRPAAIADEGYARSGACLFAMCVTLRNGRTS